MNKTTAFIFFGIIIVGVVISVITLGDFGKRVEVTAIGPSTEVTDPAKDPKSAGFESKPEPKSKGESKGKGNAPTATKKAAAVPAPVEGFTSPEAAMKSLAAKAGSKSYDEFAAAVGEETIPESIRGRVKKLIEDPKFKLDSKKPFTEISKSATAVRWALNFIPEAGGEPQQLYTDLAPDEKDTKVFDIARLSFPLQLSGLDRDEPDAATNSPGSPITVDPNKPAKSGAPDSTEAEIRGADALTIAHAFSKAVIAREFEAARALSDPSKVTDERVAALMIAVEEGEFALKDERPLVVTLSRDDITWVLTRVNAGETDSEFALELGRVGDAWKVNGLTFSKVLSVLAAQGGGGDIAYSPIVEDPTGGDSLVLYFEFDNDGLTSRTSRQLAIVADILGQSKDRVIRINGHADSMGTDDYNARLSDGRAASIRNALISMGVSPKQVVAESFGETKPRLPNFLPDGTDNPSGRSQNRRAEVYLDF